MQQSGQIEKESQTTVQSPRTPAFVAIVTAVLAAAIIGLVFTAGLGRGMDHVVEELGVEGTPTAIAVALSDQVYHLDAGYVAYATVLNKLQEVWTRGVPKGAREIQLRNDADRDLLNEGIREAASLGPQQPGFVSDHTLVTMIYEDVGYADFAKLAFRIFGLKIEAFYDTFFLLLALSAAAYLFVFRSEPVAQIVLLCTLFSFFIELHTTIFSPDMPTFPGIRHGSTLALIPALHFALLVAYRRRPSPATVLATLVQLAILLLTVRVRGSATWAVLFVPAVAVVLAVVRSCRRPPQDRTWRRLMRDAAHWPAVLLVASYFGYGAYAAAQLHPAYFTDDVTPHHGAWHGAFGGLLATAPDLIQGGDEMAARAWARHNFDQAGYAAATRYLDQSHFMPLPKDYPDSVPPGYISPWTGTIKFGLHDKIMRRVVLGIVARHPIGVLESVMVKKPVLVVDALRHIIADVPGRAWLWLLLIGGLSAFAIVRLADAAGSCTQAWLAVLLVGSALPFAALPNLWVYPFPRTMADILVASLTFLQLLVGAAAAILAVAAGRVLSLRRRRIAPQ